MLSLVSIFLAPTSGHCEQNENNAKEEQRGFFPFANVGIDSGSQGAGNSSSLRLGLIGPVYWKEDNKSFLFYDLLFGPNFDDSISIGSSTPSYSRINDDLSFSGSYRLGYRWTKNDLNILNTIYLGYDHTTAGIYVNDYISTYNEDRYFDQFAIGFEHKNDSSSYELYARYPANSQDKVLFEGFDEFSIPIEDTNQARHDVTDNISIAGYVIPTIGFDYKNIIVPKLEYSIGYYYQDIKESNSSGSGAKIKLNYKPASNIRFSLISTYDDAFGSTVSANATYVIAKKTDKLLEDEGIVSPLIESISIPMDKRDVRLATTSGNIYNCELFDPDKEVTDPTPPEFCNTEENTAATP